MADTRARWQFWDFGSRQFVRDALSGELVRVHGPGAAFDDGPFRLVVDEDRPVVVGLEGDDEHCALHFVDEIMENVVTVVQDSATKEEHCFVKARCGDKPAQSLLDLQLNMEPRSLICEVEGREPFKAQFTLYAAPSSCGEFAVQLWLDFPWLIDYVMGKGAHRRITRIVERLRYSLRQHGFSELHVADSLLSRSRRRRKTHEVDAKDDVEGSQEWHVSMVGVFVFLYDLLENRRTSTRNPAATSQWVAQNGKVRNLLTSLLSWPLSGPQCIGFACARANLEMLLEGLVVCPEPPQAKKRRGAGRSAQDCRLLRRCNVNKFKPILWAVSTTSDAAKSQTFFGLVVYVWQCVRGKKLIRSARALGSTICGTATRTRTWWICSASRSTRPGVALRHVTHLAAISLKMCGLRTSSSISLSCGRPPWATKGGANTVRYQWGC